MEYALLDAVYVNKLFIVGPTGLLVYGMASQVLYHRFGGTCWPHLQGGLHSVITM